MPNLWRRFQALLPSDPLHYAEMIAHNADGTSTVESPAGKQYRVRGQDVAVGDHAYIQSGRILEEAPSLPFHDETV